MAQLAVAAMISAGMTSRERIPGETSRSAARWRSPSSKTSRTWSMTVASTNGSNWCCFARYRANGSLIGRFDSIYVVTREGGHWGVKARSSFFPETISSSRLRL